MKPKKSYLFKNTVFKNGNESAKTVFSGPGEIEVGPAPEFEGKPEALNPEEMFVAAINSCLMTTFFYFVRRSGIEILSYHSNAEGKVEKTQDGFRFTNVEVSVKVQLKDEKFAEQIRKFGNLAEKYCLVSRSAACPVRYRLETQVKNNSK